MASQRARREPFPPLGDPRQGCWNRYGSTDLELPGVAQPFWPPRPPAELSQLERDRRESAGELQMPPAWLIAGELPPRLRARLAGKGNVTPAHVSPVKGTLSGGPSAGAASSYFRTTPYPPKQHPALTPQRGVPAGDGGPAIAGERDPTQAQLDNVRAWLEDPWPVIRSAIACLGGLMAIEVVDKASGEVTLHRFRCRSWRCPWCGPPEARVLFARLVTGLTGQEKDDLAPPPWFFLTLTYDPKARESIREAYRGGCQAGQALKERMARHLNGGGKMAARTGIEYATVWERHASGWPHAHMVLRHPALEAVVRGGGTVGFFRNRTGRRCPISGWAKLWLVPAAVSSGFGPVLDLQRADASPGGLASYFAKLASEVAGVKAYQQPTNAPKGFRRLRASRGLLPPRSKGDGETTGGMHREPVEWVRECYASGIGSRRVVPDPTKRVASW
jgi:hypothetical protein